jgi:recombination protein RecR
MLCRTKKPPSNGEKIVRKNPFMQNSVLPSKLLDAAVNEFASLPGIGYKSALRLALFMLRQPLEQTERFCNALANMRLYAKKCLVCCNISDNDICDICADPRRSQNVICVVENIRDVMSIEATMQYSGRYHVLGGVISPMDGVHPADLNIESLLKRVPSGIDEVILAIGSGMEGETTAYYIYKKLCEYPVKITALARGVGFGEELEYADEITLGRSIKNRMPYADVQT